MIFGLVSVWCANIGDSRFIQLNNKILISGMQQNYPMIISSVFKRIMSNRGKVQPYMIETGEKIGPATVWLEHEQISGLAMSMVFGDYVALTVEVTSEPEIIHHKMDANYASLIVMGSWSSFLIKKSNTQLFRIGVLI